MSTTDPTFIVIDLLCGFGGETTGFERTGGVAYVFAGLNHDHNAIVSHSVNHPHIKHFEEDIRNLDLTELVALTNRMRAKYPFAKLIVWASLECTNFSRAKGGQSRDADSRTLAESLYKQWDPVKKEFYISDSYIQLLQPDYIQIENVTEFLDWGPLDEEGYPIPEEKGTLFEQWRKDICELGYRDEWTQMNAADYGAYTSRNRLFGCFAKPGLPIVFPEPTHTKYPKKHPHRQPWKPVREVLNLKNKGESIFNRRQNMNLRKQDRKEYVEATLERVYEGLIKFVAGGWDAFLMVYNGGKPESRCTGLDQPARTLRTENCQSLAQVDFITQRNGGDPKHRLVDLNAPARSVTCTGGNMEVVQPEFLTQYYGTGKNVTSVDSPCPVIPTKDRVTIVQCGFLCKQYSTGDNNISIDSAAGAVLSNDKHYLVQAEQFIVNTNYNNTATGADQPLNVITANRKYPYLVIINPAWGGHSTTAGEPCPTVVARQDKAPLHLMQTEQGDYAIAIFDTDSPMTVKIKEFMALYGIVNIYMRALEVKELLRISGFPDNMKMFGSSTAHKKFIGNSVHPNVPEQWTYALHEAIQKITKAA